MTHAHICDECKTVAALQEHFGWWEVRAAETDAGVVLRMDEKDEYHFCSWGCLNAFATRHLAVIERRA